MAPVLRPSPIQIDEVGGNANHIRIVIGLMALTGTNELVHCLLTYFFDQLDYLSLPHQRLWSVALLELLDRP